MLAELSRWELGIWAALYAVNPWGDNRADYRAAIGHALLVNINRGKGSQPVKARDFMPYLEVTSEERQAEISDQIAAAFKTFASQSTAESRKAWKARRREIRAKK